MLVILTAFTGLRWGELVALRRDCIDLDTREITVITNSLPVITLLAQKPKITLISLGRYLYTPEFFEYLAEGWKKHGAGEYYHTGALDRQIADQAIRLFWGDAALPRAYLIFCHTIKISAGIARASIAAAVQTQAAPGKPNQPATSNSSKAGGSKLRRRLSNSFQVSIAPKPAVMLSPNAT